ncbi:uncharacterized protein LOC111088470 isoform X2 [Limulus polyphemus]|nr:uncharacterized protein LOC111088470 isoform X2 [Limulus polyphemus]XP_022254427.1 uncharacterized protein LOC111088470 isoform X2 [Limulus polyphemus]
MQTFPCGHRVVCRKCFVKTIQITVSQRVLPLRCVVCRTKIIRLRQTSHDQNTPTQFDSSRSNRDMKIEDHNLDNFTPINTVMKERGDVPVSTELPDNFQSAPKDSTHKYKKNQNFTTTNAQIPQSSRRIPPLVLTSSSTPVIRSLQQPVVKQNNSWCANSDRFLNPNYFLSLNGSSIQYNKLLPSSKTGRNLLVTSVRKQPQMSLCQSSKLFPIPENDEQEQLNEKGNVQNLAHEIVAQNKQLQTFLTVKQHQSSQQLKLQFNEEILYEKKHLQSGESNITRRISPQMESEVSQKHKQKSKAILGGNSQRTKLFSFKYFRFQTPFKVFRRKLKEDESLLMPQQLHAYHR